MILKLIIDAIKNFFKKKEPVEPQLEPPVVYMNKDDSARRPGESYYEYCQRVPLAFHPTNEPKMSYRGKPL